MEEDYNESDQLINKDDPLIKGYSFNIQRIVLKWKNITYKVKTGDSYLEVLNNVTGFSNPGEILAVMGASGSGKTSLLSILAKRINVASHDKLTGEIYANSKSLFESDSHSYVKFITQENILYDFLTPYEYLKFNLMLKMRIDENDANNRVESILNQFKLSEIKHSIIGNAFVRGISGGEKKRLCIASELMLYPSVLILDEPTSGLDSYLAKCLVSTLQEIKELGINIILSIHQPSSDIFKMFDRLIIMQEGCIVYQGEASKSLKYFEDSGFDIPRHINPPELYMRILKIEDRNNLSLDEKKVMELLKNKYLENENYIWVGMNLKCSICDVGEIVAAPNSLTRSLNWLFWREFLNYTRNPLMNVFKLFHALVLSIVFIFVFWELGYDNIGVENRRGAIICCIFGLNFIPNFPIIMSLTLEKNSTIKDITEGLYNINSYLLIKLFNESIIMIISTALIVFISYYAVNFNTESNDKIFIFWLVGAVIYMQGVVFAFFGASLSSSVFVAGICGSVTAVSLMIFAGYFNDPDSGPKYFHWLKYCTPKYYLRNAILKNEFDGLDMDENVYPRPEERFNYTGEIFENILLSLIHLMLAYTGTVLVYSYLVYKTKVKQMN